MTHIENEDIENEAGDEFEAIAENAGRYARKIFDETKHVSENAESFLATIRDKPVKASLIALGVGAVLGLLLGGRR